MKNVKLAFGFVLLFALAGCATIFGDKDRAVKVNSYPSGAKIYVNNGYMGTTPTTLTLSDIWSSNLITVKAPGYEPATRNITPAFQPVGFLNILFWPGFIVDAATGNMMKIPNDAKNITFTLDKIRK